MEGIKIHIKLKMLFEKIVEPNYVIDNYYADSIINKLSHSSDPEILNMCYVPLTTESFCDALKHKNNVSASVQVFLTRFIALITRNELHFSKFICKESESVMNIFKDINSPKISPSLKVAAMEVALGTVSHKSGIVWLLETGVWKDILSLCNEKQTVFVVRQTYKFAAILLWALNDMCDLANLKLVLSFILQPLHQYDFMNIETMSSEDEDNLALILNPMLHILTAVMKTGNRIKKHSLLIETLLKMNITSHLYLVYDRIHRADSCLLLANLIVWFTFVKPFLTKPVGPGVTYTFDDFLEVNVVYFNHIQRCVQRRNATLALDFCTAANLISWSICQENDALEWAVDETPVVMRNQMLIICLVPLMVFVKIQLQRWNGANSAGGELEAYILKLLNSSCQHITKALYAIRSLIEELDTMQIIVHSAKKLSCLKNNLDNEQANLVFQALFYVLRDYDPLDDYGVKKEEPILQYEDHQNRVLVMTYVMDTVLSLLKNYNINWQESLEVVCLYTMVYNILQRSDLSSKFVVASLSVITMTVKKFLAPNLSLLLETKPESAMHHLGKLIYLKLHDLAWEVRDSALELLLVCTEISYVKFPPLQKQILDNNLINVAAALAFNDFESYVQASALKCLGAASKINCLWEHLTTHYPTIQEQLIAVLRNNQEGIVRKEACSVLCDLYQNPKLSNSFKHCLYEHMASSAISDFHWEVQLYALKFWKMVFQSLLTDQGMLDGTFPSVTFSRATRKIVNLNDKEIQRILLHILDDLSSIGMLTVLIRLLDEDTDVNVLEYALSVSQEILDILNKYKVPDCLTPKPEETDFRDDSICQIVEDDDDVKMVSQEIDSSAADNVIESILNSDDINLLANIYERHMSLQGSQREGPVRPKVRITKAVTPYLFVNFIKSKDLKSVAEEKKRWDDGIRSISSLLDDVLRIYETDEEFNALDCY